MRKNNFFDIVMISLILMTCFKLLYPKAFDFNVTVNSYVTNNGSAGSDSSGDSNTGSDDVPVFTGEQAGEYVAYLNLGDSPINSGEFDYSVYPSGNVIYADVDCITLGDVNRNSKVVYGTLYCYLAIEDSEPLALYKFNVSSSAAFDNSLYEVVEPEDCYWICPDSATL